MSPNHKIRLSVLLLTTFAAGLSLQRAQGNSATDEKALSNRCVRELLKFAQMAKSKKVGHRAKQGFDLILEYDPDHGKARLELGFTKVKATWVAPLLGNSKKWRDKATYEDRFKVMKKWADTAIKLSNAHKKIGLKLKKAATYHLQKSVYYNPNNEEANLALGHKKGPGFYGTDAQIAFAHKMKEIKRKAVEFARKDYEVEKIPAEQMPVELKNLIEGIPDWMAKPNFDIHGARSKHFKIWTRGSQEHAIDAVKWAERALEFGVYLLGEDAKRVRFVKRATKTFDWYFFLGTGREREEFLKANKNVWEKEESIERAKDFANNSWVSATGPAVAMVRISPREVQDSMIGYVFFNGLVAGRNQGMGQGLIHAATWYMKSTSIVRWGARPEGTVGEDALELPEGTNYWMRTVRDQAVSKQFWAADQVPREKLSRFRNDCRLKAWSFSTWIWAAYPDKWLEYYRKLPRGKKVPTLEDVNAVAKGVFGRPLAELDAEWREWARGDSGVAYGTGYGPPLLPERPSKIEQTALEQINLVRAQRVGYTWEDGKSFADGKWVSLSACEMDAETSIGCDLHAKYVTNHPELTDNPDLKIHEEDPAHEDFTRRGQQAGNGNIVVSNGRATVAFARESVDGWISAPYHRFPMLRHNIKRLGYAQFASRKLSVSVLDMGSLREPYDPSTAPRLVVWPPPNSKNVPTRFGSHESPNPLADQPKNEQDVTRCGYVVSMQLQREVSRILADSDIELWEAGSRGRQPAKNFAILESKDGRDWLKRCENKNQIACYKHTPKVPLNKKRDQRDILFVVPKKWLKPGMRYQARVMLRMGGNEPLWFFWEFTCGRQPKGLKRMLK